MSDFINIGALDEFPDEGMRQVMVRGEPLGIYRVGESVYAIHDVCTHEEAFLTDGEFDADDCEVECPRHGSRFNVANGDVRILPATRPVASYQVKLEQGNVLVGPQKV